MMCSPLSANGGILCDTASQKATKDEIEFDSRDPQNFFKDQGPIECFIVLGQKNTLGKSQLMLTLPLVWNTLFNR